MARVHQRTRGSYAEEDLLLGPLQSGYLTDGRALFHVERTLVDDPKEELLVELEDCATLELIVCAASSVAELGMRSVTPLAPTAAPAPAGAP
jgi:hypothetical protein